MQSVEPLLHVSGLVAERRLSNTTPFRVSLDSLIVAPGEVVAVTGESGAGKSTLLEALALILRPKSLDAFTLQTEAGEYDLARMWQRRQREGLAGIRARYWGIVLQTGGLLPFLSLRENIVLSRRLLGLSGLGHRYEEIMDAFELAGFENHRPAQLSIGQRQRASIARAMLHDPVLVLADEPTSALDPDLSLATWRLMISIAEAAGIAFLVVTHEWRVANDLGLRQYRARPMEGGKVRGSEFREDCVA
nr:ATP-binding cassette domain-containing protein [uncultured Hyphomonas sp.]